MENSQRVARRGIKKGRILLLCLLFGFIYGLEQRYHLFRLVDFTSSSEGVISEDIVWHNIPDSAELFWPALFWKHYAIKESIERHYPLTMRLKCVGWGRFSLELQPLKPKYLLYWSGKSWFLSEDGKIWLVDLQTNKQVEGIRMPVLPLLVWDKNMPLPVSMETEKGDIIQSSVPIVKIREWYQELERIGWKEQVKRLLVMRLDGRVVMQVEFKEKNGGMTLLLRDDPADWESIAVALKGIQKDQTVHSGDISTDHRLYIDATYQGKVIVRSRDIESRSVD